MLHILRSNSFARERKQEDSQFPSSIMFPSTSESRDILHNQINGRLRGGLNEASVVSSKSRLRYAARAARYRDPIARSRRARRTQTRIIRIKSRYRGTGNVI